MRVVDADFRSLVASSVRAEMARRGLHQGQVAEVLGLPRTAVSRRLTGQTPWTVDELHAIAGIFGMDLRDLIPRAVDVDIPDYRGEAGARRRHPTAADGAAVRPDHARSDISA